MAPLITPKYFRSRALHHLSRTPVSRSVPDFEIRIDSQTNVLETRCLTLCRRSQDQKMCVYSCLRGRRSFGPFWGIRRDERRRRGVKQEWELVQIKGTLDKRVLFSILLIKPSTIWVVQQRVHN